MYLERKIEDKIIQELENYDIPILITGSRQVGKSTTILNILKNYDYIELNFQMNKNHIEIFQSKDRSIESITEKIEVITNKIITNDTILFIDEIQLSEAAFSTLKIFAERAKFRVIASGSNVSYAISNFKNELFPVGKYIEYKMYPLSFSEYLNATNNKILLNALIKGFKNFEVSDLLHEKALKIFQTYLKIGGMPKVVSNHIQNKDYKKIQLQLIDNYQIDFTKYAQEKDIKYLRTIYSELETFLGQENQVFKPSMLNFRNDLLADAYDFMSLTRMIIIVNKVKSINLPLNANATSKMKLFYNDTGLLITKANYNYEEVYKQNDKIFYGVIMENYIATVLIKYENKLFYYHKDKSEIDFILDKNSYVLPIEVKSGNNTQAKSLKQFIKDYKPKYALKLTKYNLKITDQLIELPLYGLDLIMENNISGYGVI